MENGDLTQTEVEQLHAEWRDFVPEGTPIDAELEPVERSEREWRAALPEESFVVLRKEGTERAGTSPLDREKREGLFVCAGCELPLFTSSMKFDSGTGWPSFFTSIPGHLETKRDFKLFVPRTEYHCARCGGHQGHVFGDGPAPTGQRFCNNGVALRFFARQEEPASVAEGVS